jgi:hypothetical protein
MPESRAMVCMSLTLSGPSASSAATRSTASSVSERSAPSPGGQHRARVVLGLADVLQRAVSISVSPSAAGRSVGVSSNTSVAAFLPVFDFQCASSRRLPVSSLGSRPSNSPFLIAPEKPILPPRRRTGSSPVVLFVCMISNVARLASSESFASGARTLRTLASLCESTRPLRTALTGRGRAAPDACSTPHPRADPGGLVSPATRRRHRWRARCRGSRPGRGRHQQPLDAAGSPRPGDPQARRSTTAVDGPWLQERDACRVTTGTTRRPP